MAEIKVQTGQSIFDLILQSGYSFNQTYSFLQQNPSIPNINFDFDSNPGTIVSYDPALKITTKSATNTTASTVEPTTETFIAVDGQSVFDLVLMTYLNLNKTYKFIQDNQGAIDSINDGQIAQKEFTYDKSLVDDQLIFDSNQIGSVVYCTSTFVPLDTSTYYLLADNSGDYLSYDGINILLAK